MNISRIEQNIRRVWGLPAIVPWSAQHYLAEVSHERIERLYGHPLTLEESRKILDLEAL